MISVAVGVIYSQTYHFGKLLQESKKIILAAPILLTLVCLFDLYLVYLLFFVNLIQSLGTLHVYQHQLVGTQALFVYLVHELLHVVVRHILLHVQTLLQKIVHYEAAVVLSIRENKEVPFPLRIELVVERGVDALVF